MDETHPCCIIYSKYQPPVLSIFTDVGSFYGPFLMKGRNSPTPQDFHMNVQVHLEQMKRCLAHQNESLHFD